jgi:hypothetical protein
LELQFHRFVEADNLMEVKKDAIKTAIHLKNHPPESTEAKELVNRLKMANEELMSFRRAYIPGIVGLEDKEEYSRTFRERGVGISYILY